MNIWIVSEGEPLPIDGADVRLRRMGQLCNMFSENGHEVHWFSSDYHHYKKELRQFTNRDINVVDKYYIHLLESNPYKSNVSYQRIKHHKVLAKNFMDKAKTMVIPDIILATMAPLELSETVVEFAGDNIPTIIDIRDLWPEIYNEVLPSFARPIVYPYIKYSKKKLNKTLSKATALISVTQGFLDYGLSIAGRKQQSLDHVFHTSYKKATYKDSDFDKHWGNELDKNDFIISFIGNFGKQFRLDPVIDAAKSLRTHANIKFVLCGGGQDYEKLLEYSKDLPNLIVKEWISGNEIDSLLKNTNIGLAPYKDSINFRANVPNKFGEYIAYELPILVSVEGDMKNLLETNNAGYYYKDSTDLSSKILELYNNEDLALEMSKNSKQLYNQKFNSEVVYMELVKYLEKYNKK